MLKTPVFHPDIGAAMAYLFPALRASEDYVCQDNSDGRGPHLSAFNGPGEPPTLDQIEQAASQVAIERGRRVRIFDYLKPQDETWAPPTDVDFSTACSVELHKSKNEVWQGDVLDCVYYAQASDTGELSVPVVRRRWDVSYQQGLVVVVETISWYCADNTEHPTKKVLQRYYSGQRWLDWLERKRRQIIEWLRYNVAAAMMAQLPFGDFKKPEDVLLEGGKFFAEYSSQIAAYVSGYAQDFPESVKADDRAWLDLPWPDSKGTIRDKFQEQLIYGGES